MILSGIYQPPLQATRQTAQLTLSELAGIPTLHLDQQGGAYPLSAIVVSPALGTLPVTLTFPDGSRFIPDDNQQLLLWLAQHRPRSWLHHLERDKWSIIGAFLLTLLSILFFINIILPHGSRFLAHRIPAVIQQEVGQQVLQWLDKQEFSPSRLPEERQEALQDLFFQVMTKEMAYDIPMPRLLFRHTDSAANAYMLADGSLLLSDNLVTLADNDDQLAAIMLHEMGHHQHRHLMQLIVRSSILVVAQSWLMGDTSTLADSLINGGLFVAILSFSRNMEREADQYAIEQMNRQQRSLSAMLEIFQKLEETRQEKGQDSKGSIWFSTHPATEERLDTIRHAMETLAPSSLPPISAQE